ncbi:unnamed protein product [Dibothriocephalus latus]|uniref:SH2 domain-containing protein n=1 Tax=Dibothriocephalus latus TaxID=60516 RepID=A0A3P7L7B4_DIBLA|nr:unnamed protein product [Dibothriocephalus latus]
MQEKKATVVLCSAHFKCGPALLNQFQHPKSCVPGFKVFVSCFLQQPERRAFEELETITLQPIGKGVQDLDSRMGSTTTLSQPARPTASSMMEDLNRVDNVYPSQRPRAVKNMTNLGKQASAVDISRQNHSGSTSFLAPRRVSGGALSDFGGFRGRDSGQTLRASNTVIQQKDAHQTVWAQKSPATPLTGSPTTLMQVQETAPTWYRLKISRQEAIALLRHQPPGSFLVRDSTTYKDAYGLAVRVAKSQSHTNQKSGEPSKITRCLTELAQHFLKFGHLSAYLVDASFNIRLRMTCMAA